MAVLFFQVISWVVLTRAVRTCNQRKDLPTISTVYLYCMIIVQVFCAIMSNKLFRVRVICCPAPGRPESAARGTSPPDNKSRGCCCRNSRPTVINPDYNMTKQRCMKRIYDKIRSKSPPNRATSPTCLHCDVTHLSLTTGVVALHIPSWRIEVREERRQARKIVWPVNAGRVICRYQNNLCGIINHHKHIRYWFFGCISRGFKHNRHKPYRHCRQDGGWHALSNVTHATAWRRELSLYTSRR